MMFFSLGGASFLVNSSKRTTIRLMAYPHLSYGMKYGLYMDD
jgi:hypothetical protein